MKADYKNTHPNFLLHQLPGVVDLLRRPSDCKHLNVGVSVGWRIPLELDSGSGLLADALDCLTTWQSPKHGGHYSGVGLHGESKTCGGQQRLSPLTTITVCSGLR